MGFSWGSVHNDVWFTNIIDVLFFGVVSFIVSLLFFKGIYKMERFVKFVVHHTITYGGLLAQFIFIQTFEISIRTLGYTYLPIIIEKFVFFYIPRGSLLCMVIFIVEYSETKST